MLLEVLLVLGHGHHLSSKFYQINLSTYKSDDIFIGKRYFALFTISCSSKDKPSNSGHSANILLTLFTPKSAKFKIDGGNLEFYFAKLSKTNSTA